MPALIALLLFAGVCAAAEEILTNDDVVKLHQAGLPAEVIVAKIESSETDFDTSVDAILALNEAGVPAAVITAMTKAGQPSTEVVESGSAAPGQQEVVVRQGASSAPNVRASFAGTPCSSPGIFVESAGSQQEIEPTTYSQGKSSGHVLSRLTYGAKSIKSKAVIQGTTSNVLAEASGLTFLFCFEETESGLSYESKGATNPSEFLLVELTVDAKRGQRNFVAGKLNAWTGAQSGAPPKALRPTRYKKLAPGVYRVMPASPLSAGEYGFYYAGSAPLASFGFGMASGGNKIFTFGLR
ncbi:MAG: hypothetical protein D6696_01060 [Acidobacteria bacterium]|nr:MAG: hypothetical protein D6696_01060 [Acidobacteriota bacterium]